MSHYCLDCGGLGFGHASDGSKLIKHECHKCGGTGQERPERRNPARRDLDRSIDRNHDRGRGSPAPASHGDQMFPFAMLGVFMIVSGGITVLISMISAII